MGKQRYSFSLHTNGILDVTRKQLIKRLYELQDAAEKLDRKGKMPIPKDILKKIRKQPNHLTNSDFVPI